MKRHPLRNFLKILPAGLLLVLAASLHAEEGRAPDKPDLNSVNLTLPGGSLPDDFGGPSSAPGTQSGLALYGGGASDFAAPLPQSVIQKEIRAMKQRNKRPLKTA